MEKSENKLVIARYEFEAKTSDTCGSLIKEVSELVFVLLAARSGVERPLGLRTHGPSVLKGNVHLRQKRTIRVKFYFLRYAKMPENLIN